MMMSSDRVRALTWTTAVSGLHQALRVTKNAWLTCTLGPGFFSVQVLERALQVWGLTYVGDSLRDLFHSFTLSSGSLQPWRSEKMRQYHDHPQ